MSQPKKKSKKPKRPASSERPAPDAGSESSSVDAKAPSSKTSASKTRKRPLSARQRRERRNKMFWTAGCVLGVTLLLGWFVKTQIDNRRLEAQLTAGSCSVDGKTDPGVTNQHAESVSFTVNPPSGGIHLPSAARPGDFSSGAVPPDGQIVHALEHGDVAIWYQPSIAAEELDALRQVQQDEPQDVLLVPRENLPMKVAATAWHERLLCDASEPDAIRTFVQMHKDKGPEKVPEI